MRYILLSLLFFAATSFAADIVVKPGGDIATLPAARDAVRAQRAGGEKGDINVIIHDGVYTLNETLVFGLQDAAPAGAVTRYRAAEGAHPLISGGRQINKWKRTKLQNGNIWVAKVPWAKGDAFFHCLFDGDKLLQRAQSESMMFTSEDPQKRRYAGPLNYRYEFGFNPGTLKLWKNMEDIELFGSPTRKWMVNYLPIESLDTKANRGKLSIPATYKMSGDFVVENCIDHLDATGEWVLNSQEGRLYYWPEAYTPGDHIIAPAINELIRIEGETDSSVIGAKDKPVEGIVFEGLQFSYADRQQWLPDDIGIQHDWNMWDKANGLLRFRGARNCGVKNCTFVNSGSDGVRLDLFCQDNMIEDCSFRNLGGTGVLLCGYGPGKKDVNKNNTIHYNEITKVGSLFLHSSGIFIWQSGHNRITNNHIPDLAYTGMVISGVRRRFFELVFNKMGKTNPYKQWQFPGGTRENLGAIRWDEITLDDIRDWASYESYIHVRNNVVEYNEVHDCLKLLHDGNCIYLSGNGDGNIVRHNVTYNHPEGAMIRTDDDSHGGLITGNLLFGTTGNQGVTMKGFNAVTGNVFVNCELLTGRAGNSADVNATLARNIFYHTSIKPEKGFHYGLDAMKGGLDSNVYYHKTEGLAGQLLAEQRKRSKTGIIDVNSIAADPRFIDPVQGDFGLKKDSPARKLGIKPLPIETVRSMGCFRHRFLDRFSAGVPMEIKRHSVEKSEKESTKGNELNL